MDEDTRDPGRLLRRLASAGALLAFGLVVLGGVVRISGSGLGCGDHWPRCNGHWLPPLDDIRTVIEFSHRWVAALVSLTTMAIAGVAWSRHRDDRRLLIPATLSLVLLVIQVLLGAVTVKLRLPPSIIIVHLANAMLLLAALLVTALRARRGGWHAAPSRHRDQRLVHLTAGLGFVVILFGAQVANFGAGLTCLGFPLCNGSLAPPASSLAMLHWTHRMLAFAFVALALVLAWRTGRRSSGTPAGVRRATSAVALLAVAQVVVAATMVLHLLPPVLRALHLLVGTAVWAALVIAAFLSSRLPVDAEAPLDAAPQPSRVADYVSLTKPRIISLLLVTTIAPMFITDRGLPPLGLVLWVALAGYLMAGGANTINMWFDRDIDTRMTRTRRRPIPSGRISPAAGLAFGIGLGATAFAIFWYAVNPLSAWLALGGLLFYVFIYTMWLKRTTTQNIVIGGAAGAFPPLVGWAAVTGRIDLAAIYLFAIIFYWTPPHFWALALMKQGEYAKAGVPMMPVIRGDRRTKVEMLLYTLFLIPLTIMPSFFGALGPFYLVAALLLGARLLWYCIKLLGEPTVTPTAWKMYRFSLLYLALLFVAMGIDRALPGSRRVVPRPDEVMVLDRPDAGIAIPAAALPSR